MLDLESLPVEKAYRGVRHELDLACLGLHQKLLNLPSIGFASPCHPNYETFLDIFRIEIRDIQWSLQALPSLKEKFKETAHEYLATLVDQENLFWTRLESVESFGRVAATLVKEATSVLEAFLAASNQERLLIESGYY